MSNHTKVKVSSSLWAMLTSLLLMCGCTYTVIDDKWDNQNISYKYYVIDANADVPDASFETFKEASTYQKEYAEYHDYVIVKIDERYKVYNMELDGSLESFVEKNEN